MTNGPPSNKAILAIRSTTLVMGLEPLLLSIPPIEQVIRASNLDELINLLNAIDPVLIILETSNISDDPAAALDLIRDLSPNSLRVLLSHDMIEYRELVYDSPDTVILYGTEPGRLAGMLELLLSTDGSAEAGGTIGENAADIIHA